MTQSDDSNIDSALAAWELEGLTVDMLDQARRTIDRAMANGEIAETPELHQFSRWASRAARALRETGR